MALVQCSECSAQISSLAPTCVKCGAPNLFHGMQSKPSSEIAVPKRGWLAATFSPRQHCGVCGHESQLNRVGWDFRSVLICIILFCAMVVPGLIYFFWRGSKASALCCQRCKSLTVIKF